MYSNILDYLLCNAAAFILILASEFLLLLLLSMLFYLKQDNDLHLNVFQRVMDSRKSPILRLYSYGAYISPPVFEEQNNSHFDFHIEKMIECKLPDRRKQKTPRKGRYPFDLPQYKTPYALWTV